MSSFETKRQIASGGEGGSLSIGEAIGGGTPTEILYTDNSGDLYSDSSFTRDSATQQTTILTDLSLIPGSPLTDIVGLQSGSLFGGALFGTAITVTDPADPNIFSILGAGRNATVNSTFDFTPGLTKQVSMSNSLSDDFGNVSHTVLITDDNVGLAALFRMDTNGTQIYNTTAIQLYTPNIQIAQYEGAPDGYSIPVHAGDEGQVLTSHGAGNAATWDELVVMGTPWEATYYAADGALTSDPYFYRQGYEGGTRIMSKVFSDTVLYGLDMLGDGKTQVYSNDYVSLKDARLVLHQLDSAVLYYTTDATAFDGVLIENRKTTLGSYIGGNGTNIVIDDDAEEINMSAPVAYNLELNNEVILYGNGDQLKVGWTNSGIWELFDKDTLIMTWGDVNGDVGGYQFGFNVMTGKFSTSGTHTRFVGGLSMPSVVDKPYGTTESVVESVYHYVVSGSSGATTFNLDQTYEVGQIFIFSDLGFDASTNNITIDAQTGNTITSTGGSAQTFVINSNGESVTIQKVSTTSWMVI